MSIENYTILDGLIEGCQVISPDWRYVYVNETVVKQSHTTREKLIGNRMMDVYPGIEKTPLADDIRKCLADQAYIRRENEFAYPDGTLGWFELRIQPVPDGVFILSMEITEIKRAQSQQRRADAQFRKIIETTSEGVVTTDPFGVISYVNQPFAAMLGYSAEELSNKSISDYMDAESRALAETKRERRRQGVAEQHEHRFIHRDGHDVWLRVMGNPLMDANGKLEVTIALATDITQERARLEAMGRLAAIIESSADAIIGIDLEGRVTSWNRTAERLFGYRPEEILGAPFSQVVPLDNREQDAELVRRALTGEHCPPVETQRLRKDGTTLDVVTVITAIRVGDEIVGASRISHDLTETRKSQAALEAIEGQLRQAQKMEAVGSLAGGIAHDFNNLLSVILSYTNLAIDGLTPGEPLRAELEEVYAAAERAAGLTHQLLAFSRQQIIKPQVLELNQLIRGVHKMLGRLVGENIELTILDGHELRRVRADSGQLEQVLMNLVVNARDAMPNGGQLTLETANVTLDAAYCAMHVGVTPGDYVMLAVTDTGTGMDKATQARIFDPFFTTKDKSKGTGLGLATVYGIVKQAGGHIWVYSEVGHGTTFKVYLPCTDAIADEAPRAEPATVQSTRGTETILLVEDEEAVRATMRTILRKQGYNVLEAQNGGEALLICEQFSATIHLLLTDVIMPRMNGRQLATRLTAVRPALKVLFVSGYTENTIVHHGVLEAGINYLQKPITPASLAKRVREVLDAARV